MKLIFIVPDRLQGYRLNYFALTEILNSDINFARRQQKKRAEGSQFTETGTVVVHSTVLYVRSMCNVLYVLHSHPLI